MRIRIRFVSLFTLLLLAVLRPTAGLVAGESLQETARLPGLLPQTTSDQTVYLPVVVKYYPPPPPVFGVVMISPIDDAGGLSQAVSAGAYWIDYGAFDWSLIEPIRTEPPTYNWAVVDEQSLINAAQRNLVVTARIHHTPVWAREQPEHDCSRIKRESLDEFAGFVSALANRYKMPPYDLRFWQFDSEVDVDPSLVPPDDPIGFWCWGDKTDPYYGGGYFAEMLKYVYPAVKAADWQAQVVVGGLLLGCDPRNPPPGQDCQSSRFLEGVLRGGGGPYLDFVSFHAYGYYMRVLGRMGNGNWTGGNWNVQSTAVKEKASFLRQVLDAYGYRSKGLMNLETALMCPDGSDLGLCFETQAMYVPRAYAEALAQGVVAQAWFPLKDPVWRDTGLLYEDLSPKPAYYAYSVAAQYLADVRYLAPVTAYAGIQGYAFERQSDRKRLEVVWSADGGTHSINLPEGAAAYSKYGSSLGTGTIQVDYSPVYIVGP